MSNYKETNDKSGRGNSGVLAGQDGSRKTSENHKENELLKTLDGGRRSFLKKLLISAAYVTPAILSFSIGDLEARARRRRRPTRKELKRRSRRRWR